MEHEFCASCYGTGTAYGGGTCKYCNGKGYLTPLDDKYEGMVEYNKRKTGAHV